MAAEGSGSTPRAKAVFSATKAVETYKAVQGSVLAADSSGNARGNGSGSALTFRRARSWLRLRPRAAPPTTCSAQEGRGDTKEMTSGGVDWSGPLFSAARLADEVSPAVGGRCGDRSREGSETAVTGRGGGSETAVGGRGRRQRSGSGRSRKWQWQVEETAVERHCAWIRWSCTSQCGWIGQRAGRDRA